MNEQELFETELKRLKPARPPEEFMARLAAGGPVWAGPKTRGKSRLATTARFAWLRWLVPLTPLAAAACLVVLVLGRDTADNSKPKRDSVATAAASPLKAKDVEIEQRLVASFDALARLPDGAPLRLRCRQWSDKVVVDSGKGVVIEQTQPRLEVIPVSFEIY
jgi:hypothetical protein